MSNSFTRRRTVSHSALAQFYKLQQCPMYLYHRYIEEEFAGISDITLSPPLAATGEAFERGQLGQLLDAQTYGVGPADSDLSFDENWGEGAILNLWNLIMQLGGRTVLYCRTQQI